MSGKASTFRVTRHPAINGKTGTNSGNPWAWLYTLSLDQWEELVDANLEQQTDADDTFFVVRPGSEEVIECPRDIALQAYSDVLAGRNAPSAPGAGPLASATVKKLQNIGGARMRPAKTGAESFM